MSLYPYLLKDDNSRKFGVNLSNIIIPKKKEKPMNTVKKLIVFFDGEEQDPIEVTNVDIQISNDTIVLHINSSVSEESSSKVVEDLQTPNVVEDIPSVDGIITPNANEKFLLKGDNLDTFETMSELRSNLLQEIGTLTTEHRVLESSTFNIQDIQSVEQATMDLLEIERQLVADGFKAFEIKTPEFVFEADQEHFKLIQACVICKTKDAPAEKSSNV